MNNAIAMSMSDSQNLPDQRTATHENPTFRPAERGHYNIDEWAMTVAPTQTQEILLNPDPIHRKRPRDAPAFLKPSSSGDRLPALLKILHSIPMAREALLHRDLLIPDYGRDKNWWDGTPIKHLRIVNLDTDGRQIDDDDILYETQRLMAFLGGTARAYGSAEVIADGERMRLHSDKITGFLTEWREAAARSHQDGPLVRIFDSIGTKTSTRQSHLKQSERFHCLMVRIDDEISSKGLTLYDAVDHILWTDNREGEETYLEEVGDILPIEISNLVAGETDLGVEIPASWYIDRYLPSSIDRVRDMLHRKSKIKSDLERRETTLANNTNFKDRNGARINGIGLMEKARTYLDQTVGYRGSSETGGATDPKLPIATLGSFSYEQMAKDLMILSERIAQKMQGMFNWIEAFCSPF